MGPDGEDRDPHLADGVTVARVRTLVEAPDFTVHCEDGAPKTMRTSRDGG